MKSGTEAALALVLLFTASCSHTKYHEPEDSERTARIEANAPVWIRSIDRRKVRSFGMGNTSSLRIAPGVRTVEVFYDGPAPVPSHTYRGVYHQGRARSLSSIRLKFTAEPGHSYFVAATRDDDKQTWKPFISEFPAADAK